MLLATLISNLTIRFYKAFSLTAEHFASRYFNASWWCIALELQRMRFATKVKTAPLDSTKHFLSQPGILHVGKEILPHTVVDSAACDSCQALSFMDTARVVTKEPLHDRAQPHDSTRVSRLQEEDCPTAACHPPKRSAYAARRCIMFPT